MKNVSKKLLTISLVSLPMAVGWPTAYGAEKHDQEMLLSRQDVGQGMEKADGTGNTGHANGDTGAGINEQFRDAWLLGKLEVALTLNRHLSSFSIDSDVKKGVATLSGHVESEIDRDLAEELAKSIEGITEVKNHLVIRHDEAGASEGYSWSQKIDDMTTTAIIKTRFLTHKELEGLKIHVSTENSAVNLQGTVATSEEKELAELVAGNVDGVKKVVNEIEVAK